MQYHHGWQGLQECVYIARENKHYERFLLNIESAERDTLLLSLSDSSGAGYRQAKISDAHEGLYLNSYVSVPAATCDARSFQHSDDEDVGEIQQNQL